MTKIIGLTGGIGSGKTTVANYFESLGVLVYIADAAGKKVMEYPEVIESVKQLFGESVIQDRKINRPKLAQIVFDNPEKLSALNSVIHPAVKKDFAQWLVKHQDFSFIIKEAAVLFESGTYKNCDAVITVTAPLESRIERVMLRDGSQRDEVLKRIENQWTDEMKIAKSDFIIDNTEINKMRLQAAEILKKLQNI